MFVKDTVSVRDGDRLVCEWQQPVLKINILSSFMDGKKYLWTLKMAQDHSMHQLGIHLMHDAELFVAC